MKIFITAIGTDSGKTLVSAIIVEALGADYWKPIQAGEPRDTDTVKSLVGNSASRFHPEAYLLKIPASPHASAQREGIEIELSKIKAPSTHNDLVIEGAGGVMVPLNQQDFVIDLATHLGTSVVLVSNLYLGSINHTLLTADLLKSRNIPVLGIVFNGVSNPESEQIILHHTGYPLLLRVNQEKVVSPQIVRHYADLFLQNYERFYPPKR